MIGGWSDGDYIKTLINIEHIHTPTFLIETAFSSKYKKFHTTHFSFLLLLSLIGVAHSQTSTATYTARLIVQFVSLLLFHRTTAASTTSTTNVYAVTSTVNGVRAATNAFSATAHTSDYTGSLSIPDNNDTLTLTSNTNTILSYQSSDFSMHCHTNQHCRYQTTSQLYYVLFYTTHRYAGAHFKYFNYAHTPTQLSYLFTAQ
jgi:hypothetical protein